MALATSGVVCYLASTFDTFPGDVDALKKFQSFRSPWLDDAAVAASYLARLVVVIISVPTLSLALWLVRRKADAVAVFLVFLPDGINLGLNVLVDRPRPELSFLTDPPTSPAFPSGHAFHAILLFGLLMFVLGGLIRPLWLRTALQGLLGLAILAVGASRVYLGVHWPSDVVGGYLLGGFSLIAILWVRKSYFLAASSKVFP